MRHQNLDIKGVGEVVKRVKFLVSFIMLLNGVSLKAQDTLCIQRLNIRPKFFEYNVYTLPKIHSLPNEHNGAVRFSPNRMYEYKLNFPILLNKKVQLASQLKYRGEELHLGESAQFGEKELNFKNAGAKLLYKIKPTNDVFMAGYFSWALKTDRPSFHNYSSKVEYGASFFVGKDKKDHVCAFGFASNYTFGRFSIYPLFIYKKDLSQNLLLTMFLPKSIELRKEVKPDNFYVLSQMKVVGASYSIQQDVFDGWSGKEFRRKSVNLQFGIEKEIRDWAWFSTSIGLSAPFQSILVPVGAPSRNKLHDFGQSISPYVELGLFMVVPRKLYDKIK